MMQVCDVIYGRKRGAELSAFLEASTGQPCPCKRGIPCPLMPRDAEGPTPPAPRADVVRTMLGLAGA